MVLPRYGRDRQRLRHHDAPGIKRIRPLHLLAGGFFVVYLVFLASWRFGDFSNLEGFKLEKAPKRHLAPLEQLSTLRKTNNPLHIESDDAIDVEIAERIEEQREIEEEQHDRQVEIPIKVVLPAPLIAAAPVAASADVAVTEKPREMQKVVVNETLERHIPGMPVQTVEKTTTMLEQLQPIETETAVEPVVLEKEQVAIGTIPEQIEPATTVYPFGGRHQEISGYKATMEFLEKYQYNPDESLFLFFMCSDEQFKASDWSEECVEGKKHVYEVFSKSPERNRLVTVFAGSEKYWKYQNDFYNDPDLHVKGVPCIMKWEGHSGRTEGMLVKRSLYDEPFLRYLFKNMDQQPEVLFVPENVRNKKIITVKGYNSYVDIMAQYEHEENPVPTFLMMVAGRFQKNNRPWCPYCRYSELPVEYAFYSYAPKNARMIRVEVADSYPVWRKRNEFTRDENLQLKFVPLMFHVQTIPAATANDTKSIIFTSHMARYDELEPLRELFTSFA